MNKNKKKDHSKTLFDAEIKKDGILQFLKTASPIYAEESFDKEKDFAKKREFYISILAERVLNKKELISAIHLFVGYEKEISAIILLHICYKSQKYKYDLTNFFIKKANDCRPEKSREKERKDYLLSVKMEAINLSQVFAQNQNSFAFGLDLISHIENLIPSPIVSKNSATVAVSQNKNKKIAVVRKIRLPKNPRLRKVIKVLGFFER